MSTMVARNRTGRMATRRSALEWRELIEAYQCSGEHRDAFCARHEVSVSSLSWWQWRLRQDRKTVSGSDASISAPLFVEVEPDSTVNDQPSASTSWDVELDLGGGMTLRLRRPQC